MRELECLNCPISTLSDMTQTTRQRLTEAKVRRVVLDFIEQHLQSFGNESEEATLQLSASKAIRFRVHTHRDLDDNATYSVTWKEEA